MDKIAYFNWAGISPTLPEISNTITQTEKDFKENGWFSENGVAFYDELLINCRKTVANLIGGKDHKTIALTSNTSEAINIVLRGFPRNHLRSIITTDQEHPSATISLELLAKEGVEIRTIPYSNDEKFLADLRKEITTKPELIFLSHVSYKNGKVLPICEVTKLSHEAGCQVFVDGAQAIGQLNVKVTDLGADYYAFSGHKWLFGPMGTGALWIRRELVSSISSTWIGWRSKKPIDDASRFEVGTTNIALEAGFAEATRIANTHLKQRSSISNNMKPKIYHILNRKKNVKVFSDEKSPTGMISFQIPGFNHSSLEKQAWENHRVVIKTISPPEFPESTRLSFSFLNSTSDLERLTKCLDDIYQ